MACIDVLHATGPFYCSVRSVSDTDRAMKSAGDDHKVCIDVVRDAFEG